MTEELNLQDYEKLNIQDYDNLPKCTTSKIELRTKGGRKKPTKLKQEIHNLRIKSTHEPQSSISTFDPLDIKIIQFLKKIKGFQDRKHEENSVKAKMRKRLVYGIRETQRDAEAGLIKLVLIASDIENFDVPNLIDSIIQCLISTCNEKRIPLIRASTRKKFSKALSKSGLVSLVGIRDYSGAEVLVNDILELNLIKETAEKQINQESLFA
uniref:Ribosomal protein L7Ae/L30e/S12e/Gadd45 domain-containing protein n=2 Tax=Acrobeloides nanus TaxID=290746 RepID=A0A914DP38_9BILA